MFRQVCNLIPSQMIPVLGREYAIDVRGFSMRAATLCATLVAGDVLLGDRAYVDLRFLAAPRAPDDCLYETATLVWMVVPGVLCRQGSRNGMDAVRNTGLWPAFQLRFAGG